MQPKTQLIAHDREVFDFTFANDANLFATVGADGSLRMFDLRSLEHSTILYENSTAALMKLAWNRLDPHYIATIKTEGNSTIILDIRMPSMIFTELGGHKGCVNSIAWAPQFLNHICTASDDSQALIWDINGTSEPVSAYTAGGPIDHMQWNHSHEDYIAIAFDNKVQFLKV